MTCCNDQTVSYMNIQHHMLLCVIQTQNMLELKMRLEELQMENEYQLRLRDMNYNEKMKELSDKFTQQIESLKITQQVCFFRVVLQNSGCFCLCLFLTCTVIIGHEDRDGKAGS